MVFFSSFLAGVPVIIMAFFYMLYFGAYALNKPEVVGNEIIPVVEEEVIASDQAYSEENSFIYHHYKILSQDACSALNDKFISFRPLKILPLINAKPVFVLSCLTFDLFSRPPPSLV